MERIAIRYETSTKGKLKTFLKLKLTLISLSISTLEKKVRYNQDSFF